jgi:hypothetical protein
MAFTCPIDWDTLRISPQSIDQPSKKEPIKKSTKKDNNQTQELPSDLPWNA